jgi:mono/diheme cytochrome c family protein
MRHILIGLLATTTLALADVDNGKHVYEEACISCHAKDGKGVEGLKFKIKPRDLTKSILNKEQAYKIIKKGTNHYGSSQNIMVGFEGIYSDSSLMDVADYLVDVLAKDTQKKAKNYYAESDEIADDKKAKMLKKGRKIYLRNCSWCHGIHGKADGAATKTPPDSIYPYDFTKTILTQEQIFLYSKYGAHEWGAYSTDMPAWSRKYDDFTLKSVSKYIDEVINKSKR